MYKPDKSILNESRLIERVKRILEGDVVSFADYKARKQADNVISQAQDNILRNMEQAIVIKINSIRVKFCEGPIDNPYFESGEEFSYENFQKRVYEIDYLCQAKDDFAKLDYIANITVNDESTTYTGRIDLGYGKKYTDVMDNMRNFISKRENVDVYFENEPVEYEENYYKSLVKEYDIKKEPESDPMTASYIKDYRKNPQDVQVGDILTCTWGYSMTLVDYYRVTERKAKSIRLEKLQTKILTGGGMQGTCIPSDEPAPERQQEYVKNKLFRIGVRWSNDVVCRINDHSVYFWDGKPDSYDHMD